MILGWEVDILKDGEILQIEELDCSVLEDNKCERVVIELHELHTLDEVISHTAFRS